MTIHNETFLSHRGPITCAAHVPNSHKIITSGYDSAVALFDMQTKEVNLLGYHQHLVNRISVNSTGTLAASSSSDYNVYIWDIAQRKLSNVLKGHDDDVEDFVFINDELGASVSRDWRIIIWNLTTGAINRIILGHEKDVLSINYLNNKLYTSGDDMTLRVWDINTGQQLAKFGPFETETDTCAIDSIYHRMILGCDDGIVRLFDIHTHKLLAELTGHTSAIKKVAVSPLNGDILSAAYDQKILIWDHASLSIKQQLASQSGLWERSFNWSSDGEHILAGTFDGTVLVWNAANGERLLELGQNTNQPGNACFNDVVAISANQFVSVSDDGLVRVGTLTHGHTEWQQTLTPSGGRVLMNAINYCSINRQVIAGAHNQQVYFFDETSAGLQEKKIVALQQGPINAIRSATLENYAGDLFVACYSGKIAQLSADGTLKNYINVHNNAVKALRLHPTKPIGISCCAGGSLVSWHFNGDPLINFAGHTAIIDDVSIDPSATFVASAGRDFILKIHNINDGILHNTIHLGRRSPKCLLFIAADTVIVANYWGELLRVSLIDEKIERKTIAQNGISSIAQLGDKIVVSSYDGTIYLVDIQSLTVVNQLQSMQQKVAMPAYA